MSRHIQSTAIVERICADMDLAIPLYGLCRCGRELDDPTSDKCGPCGRDEEAR